MLASPRRVVEKHYTAPVHLLTILAAAGCYLVSLVALALWPAVIGVVLAVTWPFDRDRAVAGRMLRMLAAFISRSFLFWRIRIEGELPAGGGAHVVVSNHQSVLDVFLISNLPREMKWVAKRELFNIPWIGWFFYLVGDIPVKRGDARSAARVMTTARAYLDRGMSVFFFPEGTRSRDGSMLPFKLGAFKLAMEAGVPVLPLAVSGTAQGMPKGSPWVRPSRLTLRILEPVPTAGRSPEEAGALRDEVRERIARAIAS